MNGVLDKGRVIAGRYRVRGVLALSAVTVVYEVEDLDRNRLAALKVVEFSPASLERKQQFAREALMLMTVRCPYVVRVLDVGVHGECVFVATEFVDGRNLAQELAVQTRLAVDDAVTFVLHLVIALRSARDAGVAHHALRIENVLLANQYGELLAKVLGFGLAKKWTERSADTLGCLTPERISRGTVADGRADVWTLGVILHELLAGVKPFAPQQAFAVREAVLRREARPLEIVRDAVPFALAQIVHRALSRRAEGRYESVEDLALALIPFAHPGLVVRSPPPISLIRDLESGAQTEKPGSKPWQRVCQDGTPRHRDRDATVAAWPASTWPHLGWAFWGSRRRSSPERAARGIP